MGTGEAVSSKDKIDHHRAANEQVVRVSNRSTRRTQLSKSRRHRRRADRYEICEIRAPEYSSELTWHRVHRPDRSIVTTVSTRKAATDAISKDKTRTRSINTEAK